MSDKVRSAAKGLGALSAYNILQFLVHRLDMALYICWCVSCIFTFFARESFYFHMDTPHVHCQLMTKCKSIATQLASIVFDFVMDCLFMLLKIILPSGRVGAFVTLKSFDISVSALHMSL